MWSLRRLTDSSWVRLLILIIYFIVYYYQYSQSCSTCRVCVLFSGNNRVNKSSTVHIHMNIYIQYMHISERRVFVQDYLWSNWSCRTLVTFVNAAQYSCFFLYLSVWNARITILLSNSYDQPYLSAQQTATN